MMVGGEGPRMLRLAARYGDLWNTGYTGGPETMVERLARIDAACGEVGRDPKTLGATAFVGLWFPGLQAEKPRFFDNPLKGTAREVAGAMSGYEGLGVQHIIFQCEPYTGESLGQLTEALQIYRGMR